MKSLMVYLTREHKMYNYTKMASKTAINRKTASAPCKYLRANGYLYGFKSLLDFGCGHGADLEFYKLSMRSVRGYDCNQESFSAPIVGSFEVVTCTYVLNTLPKSERFKIYPCLVADTQVCFVTVRRDIKKEGLTSKGTYQENVNVQADCGELGIQCESIVHKKGQFEIFQLKGK